MIKFCAVLVLCPCPVLLHSLLSFSYSLFSTFFPPSLHSISYFFNLNRNHGQTQWQCWWCTVFPRLDAWASISRLCVACPASKGAEPFLKASRPYYVHSTRRQNKQRRLKRVGRLIEERLYVNISLTAGSPRGLTSCPLRMQQITHYTVTWVITYNQNVEEV